MAGESIPVPPPEGYVAPPPSPKSEGAEQVCSVCGVIPATTSVVSEDRAPGSPPKRSQDNPTNTPLPDGKYDVIRGQLVPHRNSRSIFGNSCEVEIIDGVIYGWPDEKRAFKGS